MSERSAEGDEADKGGEFAHSDLKMLDEEPSTSLQFMKGNSRLCHEKGSRDCDILRGRGLWLGQRER